ncbi:MAG: hypothetical protein QF724_09260 [Planctomycetota bacterium]|nr:hypothetical protein [Planctomycetota bacterium]
MRGRIDAPRCWPLGSVLVLAFCAACSGEADEARRAQDELRREVDELRAELAGQERVNSTLRNDMEVQEEAHRKREGEWLAYTRALASLPLPDVPAAPDFVAPVEVNAVPAEPSAEELAREEELRRLVAWDRDACATLDGLLRAEGVTGLDFLTLGAPGEGQAGPVVVRLADERGRPVGNLHAQHFHLEASHAGQSVTLVFEDGGESHGGRPEIPFEHGTRRMPLVGVAPKPWLEVLPGLFPEDERAGPSVEDDLELARRVKALGELLLEDTSDGFWRLKACVALSGRTFLEIQLEHRNREGRLDKRLFADQLTASAMTNAAANTMNSGAGGVVLRLTQGVQDIGGELRPFLQGRHKIFLPSADAKAWRAAGLLAP